MSIQPLLLLCLLLLTACNKFPTTDNTPAVAKTFFDLKGFFEQEIAYLEQEPFKVQKTIHNNDQEEHQVVSIKDWERELSFFIQSDINIPSWSDQYYIDSVQSEQQLSLHYKCINKDLPTQMLDIKIIADTVQSIVIVRNINNQVYSTQQYLTYLPKKYYQIKQTQTTQFLSTNTSSIESTFLYE